LKLWLVTSNEHKYIELSEVLSSFGVKLEMLSTGKAEVRHEDIGVIALQAARLAYRTYRLPLIVDDSGLYIEVLGGFPGPYSNYVYSTLGLRGILKLMEGVSNRRACFQAAIAAIIPPFEKVFRGSVCGNIALEPRGTQGFGFDPIFIPEGGGGRTFAEMSVEEKNLLSHRARAARSLGEWLVRRFAGKRL